MQSMPDMAALLRIAQSPAGQKLLSMLQGTQIDRITAAAAAGNYEEAKKMLSAASVNRHRFPKHTPLFR